MKFIVLALVFQFAYIYSILILDEDTYLITTSYSVPKMRYRAHAQICKPLLHSTYHSSVTLFKYLVSSFIQIKEECN